MLYFKINPANNSIIEAISSERPLTDYNTKQSAQQNGKPYLVEVTVANVTTEPLLETIDGYTDSYDGIVARRTPRVRLLRADEITANEFNALNNELVAQRVQFYKLLNILLEDYIQRKGGLAALSPNVQSILDATKNVRAKLV